ncbi:MAG TPA: helix-turn-helix transcriptional regulator [Clostridia bacterium]|nr:helix-turn-helix transcriptional regulator [Clostridia bacterium]
MKCKIFCTKNTKHPPYLKLKGFCAENKIKQTEIAKLLKLSPVTVNKKINGSLDFMVREADAFCEEYNCSMDLFSTRKFYNNNSIAQNACRIS